MATIEPGDTERSTEALAGFLNDLDGILSDVVAGPQGLLPADLHDRFSAAWPDVQPLFESAREVVVALRPTAALEIVGLTGTQLDLKTAIFGRAREEYRRLRTPSLLSRVLRAANNILKSLPVPSAIKDPIEEFKSAVELAAEEVHEAGATPEEESPSRPPRSGSWPL